MTSERLMDINEVADYLNVTVAAVRKWQRQGKIAFIKLGSKVRFHPEDVEAFVQQSRTQEKLAN